MGAAVRSLADEKPSTSRLPGLPEVPSPLEIGACFLCDVFAFLRKFFFFLGFHL